MDTNIKNKGPGNGSEDLREQVQALQTQVETLQTLLQSVTQSPAATAANVMLARESVRIKRQQHAAKEVGASKMVKVRTYGRAEKIVDKKRTPFPTIGLPVALSPTWRSRGIWPDAPTVLLPEDEKGNRLTHTIPERVYQSLKDVLVLESESRI